MRKSGYIEHNRLTVSMPQFSGVPSVLIPGALDWYGVYEECIKGPCTNINALFSPPGWTSFAVGAASLINPVDFAGGAWLLNLGTGADNDTLQITLGDGLMGSFVVADGRDIWFETRIQHSMVGEINVGAGLINPAAATYLADNGGASASTDYLMFETRDGEAAVGWNATGRKATGVAVYSPLTVARVAATWITLGIHVSGVTPTYVADFYVNRVLVAAGQQIFAQVPLVPLMPFVGIKTGHAGVESLTVDYIMCAQKR